MDTILVGRYKYGKCMHRVGVSAVQNTYLVHVYLVISVHCILLLPTCSATMYQLVQVCMTSATCGTAWSIICIVILKDPHTQYSATLLVSYDSVLVGKYTNSDR